MKVAYVSWLPSADIHANISHLVSGKSELEFEQPFFFK